MKVLELKSALKTKSEWYEYIEQLKKAGIIDLEGSYKMYHAIRDSRLPE